MYLLYNNISFPANFALFTITIVRRVREIALRRDIHKEVLPGRMVVDIIIICLCWNDCEYQYSPGKPYFIYMQNYNVALVFPRIDADPQKWNYRRACPFAFLFTLKICCCFSFNETDVHLEKKAHMIDLHAFKIDCRCPCKRRCNRIFHQPGFLFFYHKKLGTENLYIAVHHANQSDLKRLRFTECVW